MDLGERIRMTLKTARLTPRHLGGALKIHFVTIYRAINGDNTTSPSHSHTITIALNKIDKLLSDGKLPFPSKLSRVEKTQQLSKLLENHD